MNDKRSKVIGNKNTYITETTSYIRIYFGT